MAAASRAARGPAPRAPPPRCATSGTPSINAHTALAATNNPGLRMCPLVDRLAGGRAPRESIRGPHEVHHQPAILPSHAGRMNGDDDRVADLERVARDA